MEVITSTREELNPYKLANIAKLSYYDEIIFKQEIINFTKPDDIYFYDASIDDYSDAQMYTLIYKDKIIFSIRGTSSIKDAITDINFIKTIFQDVQYTTNKKKYKNIKVHKGFLSQFNTIKFRIISYVFSALWGNKCKNTITDKIHIIFTSHSLGAAISTLASTMLKSHFNDKIFIENWAFGCPRVGNNNFIKYYEDNVDMSNIYIYGNDIVTKIPKLGFKTFKKCIYLKDIFEKPNWCIKQINYYFGEIDDHYIDNYIRALDTDKTILIKNSKVKTTIITMKNSLQNIDYHDNLNYNTNNKNDDDICSNSSERNDSINEYRVKKEESKYTETENKEEEEVISRSSIISVSSVII